MTSDPPTDREIARAQALGRAAGAAGSNLSTCPYKADRPALRIRWGIAYAGAHLVAFGGWDNEEALTLVGRFGRWWNGSEDDD